MPLEATMMVIDNSEYMRNGDYMPTRFDALADAVNVVFQTKADANPENSVGVMTMAGKGPEVLVTHTRELGSINKALHDTRLGKISGYSDLPTAINVATLALKHRENKNQRQRIIVFLGSPLDGEGVEASNLTRLAKKLKKNNIAVDIICFGDAIDESENPVLKAFIDNVNSSDNSHLVNAPPDPRRLLSEQVISSSVLAADRGDRDAAMVEALGGPSGGGGGDFDDLGVDPSLDPELAMALRMSLEEERARKAAQAAAENKAAESSGGESSTSGAATGASSDASTKVPAVDDEDDEEAALQKALLMSQQDVEMGEGASAPPTAGAAGGGDSMDEDMSEEEAIARAIEMSMQPEDEQKK